MRFVGGVGEEAEEDEVAVPAVLFVEAAAGDYVGVGEIEETFFGEGFGVEVAEMMDELWEWSDLDGAVLLEVEEGLRC